MSFICEHEHIGDTDTTRTPCSNVLQQVSNRHYIGHKLCEDLQPFKGIK
jgi:hypothetical protein